MISSRKLFIFISLLFSILVLSLYILVHYKEPARFSENFKELLHIEKSITKVSNRLGYGGYIHNFKNYIIRGKEEYRDSSIKKYKELLSEINTLKNISLFKEYHNEILTIENTVKEYNEKLQITTKYRESGLSIKEIDKLVRVDDSEAIKSLKKIEEVVKEEELITFESLESYRFFYQSKSFHVLLFLVTLTVLLTIYELYLLADVSKASEKFYRSLFEVINQPILVFDSNGNLTFKNSQFDKLKQCECTKDKSQSIENIFKDTMIADDINHTLRKREKSKFVGQLCKDDDKRYEINISFSNGKNLSIGDYGLIIFKDVTEGFKEAGVKEVQHRVKNSFALFFSMVDMLKRRYSDTPEAVDALSNIQSKLSSLSALYHNEQGIGKKNSLSLRLYFDTLKNDISNISGNYFDFVIHIDDDISISSKDTIALGIIFTEATMNSIKHAKVDDILKIYFTIINFKGGLKVTISDNGQPKESDTTERKGLGQDLIKILSLQLNFEVEIDKTNGYKIILTQKNRYEEIS
ncbi:MAG: sensor histidine kinase [Bdellovibrionota bacterium]|nr:sensor histidine kinase [Bdellovibrionota bacterium]